MTVRLPITSTAQLQVRELEERIKAAESIPNELNNLKIEIAKEDGEIWTELDGHAEAINQLDLGFKGFQIRLQEEQIVKPVFNVVEDRIELIKPVFHVEESHSTVLKPVFHVEEKHEVVIKQNIQEITKIHNINKNVVGITIGLLVLNIVLEILCQIIIIR